MHLDMSHRFVLVLSSLLSLLGCTSSAEPAVSCGEGAFFADANARYCAYDRPTECPAELSHSLPVGSGTVCSDFTKSLVELPPEVCRGLNERECGTESEACAAPLPEAESICALEQPPLGEPTGPWEIPLRHPDGSLLEDGDRVLAGTRHGRLYLPIDLELDPFVEEIGWRCYGVEARVVYEDGTVVESGGSLSAYLSDDTVHRVDVPIRGLGRATVQLRTRWHDEQVLVTEREIEIDCAL